MKVAFSYNDRYAIDESFIVDVISVRYLFDAIEKQCIVQNHSLDVYVINYHGRNIFLGTGYISKKGDFLGVNISSYGFGVLKDMLFDEDNDLPF